MNRRYGSIGARFSQADPYDGSYNMNDPQSFNRYSYVQNDPVNSTDPSGLMPSDGCGADLSFAQCYGIGQWDPFFGGSFGRGNDGWGSDPNPGGDIIGAREQERSTAIQITRQFRFIPANAHYLGGLTWGWTDYSQDEAPSYSYSFTIDRLSTLTMWNGKFGWDGGSLFRGIDGYPYEKGGLETDWNTQIAIGSILNGLRGAVSGAIRGSTTAATEDFATRQLNTLLTATVEKGNYGLGSATYDEAMLIGESWVGPGAKLMSSGKGWISTNGLRAFRFPSLKAGSGLTQANVLRLETSIWKTGKYIVTANGHITIR